MGSVYRNKGGKTWMLRYSSGGRRIAESSGTTNLAEAKLLLREREAGAGAATGVSVSTFRLGSTIREAMDRLQERDGIPLSEQVRRALVPWLADKGVLDSTEA